METQVERPEQRKDVHQDEQNHGRHDECHLQLVVAHPARRLMWLVGLHIFNETCGSDSKMEGGKGLEGRREVWKIG